jgi:hypothetical protein
VPRVLCVLFACVEWRFLLHQPHGSNKMRPLDRFTHDSIAARNG